MFDIGFTELMLIGVVALIVVGPNDLPKLFHTLGRITARLRGLGREFTQAMNAAARESGMEEVAKDLKGMTNPGSYGLDKLNEAADKFENWSPSASARDPKKTDTGEPQRRADVEKIRAMTEAKGRGTTAREGADTTGASGTAASAQGTAPQPADPKPAAGAAETKTDDT
ncbi:MAG: twin-arginine translocase subunit TatB [Rhodobacterales bacterium]|nr:MAG: twin-arginine translocase subunit TatB [Rhodobacterales bacterium]